MHRSDRGRVAVAFTLILLASMVGGAAAVPSAGGGDATTESARALDRPLVDSTGETRDVGGSTAGRGQADDVIVQTQRYALTPDRPGSVRVTLSYDLPDRVRSFRAVLLEEATVTGTDGFDRVNATTYEWDESTSTPRIALRYNPNETTTRTGPEAAGGRYVFADAGEWALVTQFRTSSEWSYTGTGDLDTIERDLETAGPGVAGQRLLYLGEARTVERTAGDQTVRLVVPEAATLSASPAAILDSLTNASTALDVGDRDETVTAFAAPTGQVDWGVRGIAYGGSEFWVRDFERLDDPGNAWVHEYIHTRQDFETTPETRWLTEGTAQYYAALLTLEQDRISFAAFRRQLAGGGRSTYDDVVLSEPATWTANANYVKGALAAGQLDRALRASTNRSATLEDVLRELDGREEPVTQLAFLEAVAAAGGADPRAAAAEYTETTAALSMWDERTYARLFGVLPAQISYGLPNATDGYRASGPYRNGTVSTTPVRLAAGESLTVGAVVRNTGGEAGTYNATLSVDGRAVDSATGTVDAESERTVALTHAFEQAGEYTLGVGEETVTVVVEPPAEPAVSEVGVDSERVRQGESVVVTATVRNAAAVPANGTVAFTRDGEAVAQRTVTLEPGNSTQVSVTVALPTAGERLLGAGSTAVTVTVVAPTATGTSGGSGAGFTAPLAVLAALAALLWRR